MPPLAEQTSSHGAVGCRAVFRLSRPPVRIGLVAPPSLPGGTREIPTDREGSYEGLRGARGDCGHTRRTHREAGVRTGEIVLFRLAKNIPAAAGITEMEFLPRLSSPERSSPQAVNARRQIEIPIRQPARVVAH
jgi:hypothetical protein